MLTEYAILYLSHLVMLGAHKKIPKEWKEKSTRIFKPEKGVDGVDKTHRSFRNERNFTLILKNKRSTPIVRKEHDTNLLRTGIECYKFIFLNAGM